MQTGSPSSRGASATTPSSLFLSLANSGLLRFARNDDGSRVEAGASLFLIRLFRHAVEAILHFLHLPAQIVDITAVGRRLRRLLRLARRKRRNERLEHRERLLEQFHVAADVFFQRSKRRPA